jgi:hypothetical protein
MFFQQSGAEKAPITSEDLQIANRYSEVLKKIRTDVEALRTPGGFASTITTELTNVAEVAEALNTSFVASRMRIQEMARSVSEATPGIVKLGGSIEAVGGAIQGIAAGTRRNLVAQKEQVEELYATSKILGTVTSKIVDEFTEAGYSYENIAKKLEESIVYVQRIGLNAKVVVSDVLNNTDKLARFNFSEGVLGFTKMAAQASRLRFDMKEVFTLADKVLNPEDAVRMASAFQRLGVSVGNLTDPFQLMNQSINDPSGLQDSIINMAKSFTYFDEKTKSFRVSPQGILTMNALAAETDLSAENLKRTALAAAEMDDKLKRISTTGLSFNVSEEDKKMIANVASMGKEGEYEVSIKDERGNEYQRKLVDLQEQDFKRIIEQQEKAPKTVQQIQESQLNTAEKTYAEIKFIKELVKTSIYTQPGFLRNMEDALNMTRKSAEGFAKAVRKSGYFRDAEEIREKLKEAQKLPDADRKKQEDLLFKELMNLTQRLPDAFKNYEIERQRQQGDMGDMMKSILTSTGFDMFGEPTGRRPLRRASGGLVTGPGTSTSDSIDAKLSNGEFVVNAASTKSFLPILNAINESGLKSTSTGMSMKVSFDEKTPIPAELTVKLPPDFSSMPSYPAFTEYILQSPETVKQALLEVTEGALLRAGKIAKKGQYSVTT